MRTEANAAASGPGPSRRTTRPRGRRVFAIARERNPIRRWLKLLGPGFITGAADDDPSGIGTYAVAGATLGLATLWTAFLTFPLMAAVQNVCARLGMVTGMGLAGVLRRNYPKAVVYPAVLLLLVANTINIGADLEAVADAINLLVGLPMSWVVAPLALAIIAVQVFAGYRRIATVFKWLTLALVAYVIDAFIIRPDPVRVLRATFVPVLSADRAYLTTLVAILGTTISPYLFFWQSSQEVEEKKAEGLTRLAERRGGTPAEIRFATIDVNVGMAVSNAVMYFIILATALTLHESGRPIATAADAARALEPLAGRLAGVVFAVGIVGTGLLAIPVLSGSAAYAVAETFGWREGLDLPWSRARPFYAVIAAATLAGVLMDFTGVKPMDALFWTAVVNGIAAPPLLVVVMLAARSRAVMGERRIGLPLTLLGWLATLATSVTVLGLLYSTVGP